MYTDGITFGICTNHVYCQTYAVLTLFHFRSASSSANGEI